ncbi:histidine kinase, partial [bacterium]|nr:histidine kinase [bacterium]
ALEIIEKGPIPDVVLLDLMMPVMSGYEVLEILRKQYNPAELVIILLTAKNRVEDLVNGFELGANDYIVKPFSKDELFARIRAHIKLKKTVSRLRKEQVIRVKETKQKELALISAEKEKMEKLRYQLNPHFLFNALTTIRGVMLSNIDTARDMVATLADFCRLALSRGAEEEVTIEEEMEMIQLFLKMEQIRLGNYLEVTIDIDPDSTHKTVPTFLIQPLIENAIKYGRMTCKHHLELVIIVRFEEGDRICFSISNTGSWVEPGSNMTGTSLGVGLSNIRQRLDKWYSGDYELNKQIEDGWVRFHIKIPAKIPSRQVSAIT